MLSSLASRITALGLIVLVTVAALAGLLVDASHQTRQSFVGVNHSATVIEVTEEALENLRDAESGQRGFVLTHDQAYASSFVSATANAAEKIVQVVRLTRDNPVQNARAREIADLVGRRIDILRQPLELGRRKNFVGALAIISSGRGRELMDAISVRARAFLDQERVLQQARQAAAEQRLTVGKRSAVIGALVVALLILVGLSLIIRAIHKPLATMLRAMTGLADGEHVRIETVMGSSEFARLARGYNTMADRLAAAVADQAGGEQRLQVANTTLERTAAALRERSDVIELLGGMAHRMQAARTDDELAQIIRVFVPRVLPGISGALYAHNNSRNLLVPIAGWGDFETGPDGFAPDQCWALRRGQAHWVAQPGDDIVCAHVAHGEVYHCEPLLAGGEVIGVLHLRGQVGAESRFRLTVLAENIASALVNHRLQRSLREQTIRDPLTGLFNRRYMEEAMTLEIARAARSGAPLSMVMCDVDHFKRFNDDHGHDAGDAVLQAVAAEMKSRFRDGDVVCRFGGEEFTVIAPGTSSEALMARVEAVRLAIAELNIKQNGRTLGATSMSFGIATWNDTMARDGSTLIQAADAALYEAKREGRNRATIFRLAA
nr:diguanylate cyclase [uncultured Sphingomonas sp.]